MKLRTVRSKLFLGMGTVILSFIFLSLLVLGQIINNFAELEVTQSLQLGKQALKQFMGLRYKLLKDKARSLAQTPYLKATLNISRVDHDTVYYSAKKLLEIAEAPLLVVIGPEGKLLADGSDSSLSGQDLREYPGLKAALAGEESAVIWRHRGSFFMVATAPITAGQQVLGVLGVGDSLDAQLTKEIHEATGREVTILHSGSPIAESRSSGGTDGADRLAVTVPLEGTEVRVVLSRALKEITALYQTAWVWLLGAGLTTAGVAIAMSQLISRKLSRPLQELMKASNAMAQGDLTVSVREEGSDEIARLSSSFNAMARKIEDLVENVRNAAEKAESANRLKSSFLANMSHEIRTPMTAILGYSELVKERVRDDRQALSDLGVIQRSGLHLLELIDRILDISKIESGQLKLERLRCSPAQIIAEVVSVVAVPALDKGIKLEESPLTPIPEWIFSDPTRIRQALINLVQNGVKFTDRGSVRLNVSAERAQGNLWRLEFRVEDTGIGIPQDRLDDLFKPFVQVDPSYTRKYGGTGLGLSISRRLAQLLGGELKVTSKVGTGSVFTFSILSEAPEGVRLVQGPAGSATREVPAAAPAVVRLRGRVLVVDDTPENLDLIRALLERSGASVEVAENGAAALEKCSRDAFDVIIMDIQMPVLNGFQALEALRRRGVGAPVIALTAHAMLGDEERCLQAGFNSYLSKPLSPESLTASVARFLERAAQPS